MRFVKNSVLAVLVVLFATVYADQVGNVSAVSEASPGVSPVVENKEPETTVLPTRVPNPPAETPSLVHHSTAPPAEEKTTVSAATMQSAPGKADGDTKNSENGSATSRNPVYPLVFSTAAVVLLSAYSRV